jgi:hypothetical protein
LLGRTGETNTVDALAAAVRSARHEATIIAGPSGICWGAAFADGRFLIIAGMPRRSRGQTAGAR